MKRILAVVAAGVLLSFFVPHGAWAFGVKDVVAMSRDGVPDSLIIEKIRHSDTRFDLGAKDFHALKEAGVSNDVVAAMLRTERRGYGGGYYHYGYWPYDDPYFGPYYSPWRVDLDFGYYAPYHRAYFPIYGGRRFGYGGFGGRGSGYRRR